MPHTQTIILEGANINEIKSKTPDVLLQPGSTGRTEIFCKTFAGVCLVFLGPLMRLAWVGNLFASHLVPAGATITARGGFGGPFNFDPHAYIEWRIDAAVAQDARMNLGPVALLVIVAAFGVVLAILAWGISRVTMSIQAIIDIIPDPTTPKGFAIWAAVAVVGALLLFGTSRRRKNDT